MQKGISSERHYTKTTAKTQAENRAAVGPARKTAGESKRAKPNGDERTQHQIRSQRQNPRTGLWRHRTDAAVGRTHWSGRSRRRQAAPLALVAK